MALSGWFDNGTLCSRVVTSSAAIEQGEQKRSESSSRFVAGYRREELLGIVRTVAEVASRPGIVRSLLLRFF